jgi:hypothetical protein
MAGKEDIAPVFAQSPGILDNIRAIAVRTGQDQAVGKPGSFLKNIKGLDKPDMVLNGMIQPGNAKYIGTAETEGLD